MRPRGRGPRRVLVPALFPMLAAKRDEEGRGAVFARLPHKSEFPWMLPQDLLAAGVAGAETTPRRRASWSFTICATRTGLGASSPPLRHAFACGEASTARTGTGTRTPCRALGRVPARSPRGWRTLRVWRQIGHVDGHALALDCENRDPLASAPLRAPGYFASHVGLISVRMTDGRGAVAQFRPPCAAEPGGGLSTDASKWPRLAFVGYVSKCACRRRYVASVTAPVLDPRGEPLVPPHELLFPRSHRCYYRCVTSYPTLAKAPIVEALLDIQVELPVAVDIARLAAVQEPLRQRYPTRDERIHWVGDFDPRRENAGFASQSRTVDGYFFKSTDQRQVVQSRLDGFSFSRLEPYERWPLFVEEARATWTHYAAVVGPRRISRLGLRFINRIKLPRASDFSDYFTTLPQVAPSLPQNLAGLFMRLVLPYEAGVAVIFTQTVEDASITEEILPLIVDVDANSQVDLPATDENLWTKFERLRELKNAVFFESVTEKALALFR
jgi:uncharacterized protein (TIGR04255 family)